MSFKIYIYYIINLLNSYFTLNFLHYYILQFSSFKLYMDSISVYFRIQ